MDDWNFFVDVFVIGAAFGKVICFAIGFANISELVFIEGAPDHNSAHLEILMILLVEIPLLPPRLLPEKVNIDDFFHLLFAFFLLLGCFQTVVVVDSV